MKYKKGYKYQLVEDYQIKVPDVKIPKRVSTDNDYVSMGIYGDVLIRAGYAWDGATSAIDTKNFMRGSLVHDALYQLIRRGLLDSSYRKQADDILRQILREDGMSWVRSLWVYKAVRMFGGKYILPKSSREVLEAP